MKVKRKGNNNMYPFLSSTSPSPSSSSSYKDPDSLLKLLPVAILALALSLPNQDREVLAYLIARSIIVPSTSNLNTKKNCKTHFHCKNKNVQKVPPFHQCGCFDCYTSFWYRWDSSPNRDHIHNVIEAFEEHLLQNELPKKRTRGRKRANKINNIGGSVVESDCSGFKPESEPQMISAAEGKCDVVLTAEENMEGAREREEEDEEEKMGMEVVTVQVQALVANHKGLARKVLPDVMGLLNSRLWSLWSPGV